MKGQLQKIETLGDGSAKLSVYIKREDLINAVPLAYQEVNITLASDSPEEAKPDKTELLQGIKKAMDQIADLLEEGMSCST